MLKNRRSREGLKKIDQQHCLTVSHRQRGLREADAVSDSELAIDGIQAIATNRSSAGRRMVEFAQRIKKVHSPNDEHTHDEIWW